MIMIANVLVVEKWVLSPGRLRQTETFDGADQTSESLHRRDVERREETWRDEKRRIEKERRSETIVANREFLLKSEYEPLICTSMGSLFRHCPVRQSTSGKLITVTHRLKG